MNKVLLLTKVLLKNAGSVWGRKQGSGWKRLLLVLTIGIGLIPLMLGGGFFLLALYDGLALLGQEAALLGLGFTVCSLAVFVFGILYVLSVFYYAQDVEQLLPLPLRSAHILGAKLMVALCYEYLTALFLLGPFLVTYGMKSGGGFLYYLFAILIFLLVPIVPLVMAALLVMLFMRFTNVGKSKERFRLISGLLAMVAVIGFQMFVQRQTSGEAGSLEQLQQLIVSQEHALLNLVTQLFPAGKLAALALQDSGTLESLGFLAAFVLVTVCSLLVFLVVGNRFYFAGVMGISEAVAKRKTLEGAAFQKLVKQRSPLMSFFWKEWKMLWRTPVFFLNCTLSGILAPIVVLLPFLARQDSGEQLAYLQAALQGEQAGGISLAIAFAAFLVMGALNSASVTAISRDGQGFFYNKTLPILPQQLLLAKVMPGVILSTISMLLLLVEATWLLGLSGEFVFGAILCGIPGMLFMNLLGIMIDLHMPKLGWSTEQEAVKHNLNPLFSVLLGMVAGGLTIAVLIQVRPSLFAAALGLFALFSLVDLGIFRLLVTKGRGWLEKIEE
ncbi:putative ABC transporter permease subunit [Brevibacillus sp. SAFN-007a]|uniref:putative ABC transporter permease subunit n=1 Tax=Brevibacillus sp. SAFN-007a TaxID=3436862 RepID=UPI003F808A1A